MKRVITILLTFTLAFSIYAPNTYASMRRYDYTVLIYMNGSDLESLDHSATIDIVEMIHANIGENVAVIIETGGTNDWHTDEYGLTEISSSVNQRYRVLDRELELLQNVGNENMGESETLEDFINFGVANYPAKNYALFFWNHGAGAVYGFGVDEEYNYDSLTIEEMNTALSNAYEKNKVSFDLFGFDACLMSSLEIADMLSEYGEYLVASEELEPGHGWDYTSLFNAISSNPMIEGNQLGEEIAQGYVNHAKANYTEDTITISVIDLSKVTALKSAFEKLVTKVNTGLSNESLVSNLIKIRLASESYGEADSYSEGSDMMDIGDYATNLLNIYENDAANVLEALDEAVLYNVNSRMKPNATGLSIYMPGTNINDEELDYVLDIYYTMGFSDIYAGFLADYSWVLLSGAESIGQNENGISYSDIYADNSNYYIDVDQSYLEGINEIYTITGYIDNDGDISYLGNNLVNTSNIMDDGTVIGETADYWASLNGHRASLYFDGYDESGALYYYIPISVNDTDYDLLVLFSDENREGKIIGARPLMDPNANYYERNLVQVMQGDQITLLCEYSEYTGDDYEYAGWYEYTQFRVDDELTLSWEVLEPGDYVYSFELVDIYQNHYYTQWQLFDYYKADISYEEWLDSLWDVINSQTDGELVVNRVEIYDWLIDENDMPSDWALDYIDWAYYYGLTTSNTLSEFTNDISREEFCELAVNMYEVSTGYEMNVGNGSFEDTDNKAILKAYEYGIVKGDGNGLFRPNDEITREELITMFYRTLMLLDDSLMDENYGDINFDDNYLISDWALESCEFMVYWNLISGVGNNNLSPNTYATKEEALKLVKDVYEFYKINNI